MLNVADRVSPRHFERALIAARAEKLFRDQIERDRRFRAGETGKSI